jgi:hypothetical protein
VIPYRHLSMLFKLTDDFESSDSCVISGLIVKGNVNIKEIFE